MSEISDGRCTRGNHKIVKIVGLVEASKQGNRTFSNIENACTDAQRVKCLSYTYGIFSRNIAQCVYTPRLCNPYLRRDIYNNIIL